MTTGSSTPTTFHRPPRAYPEPVPSQPLRIGPPPTVPPPPHYGVLQTLFPVVGGVGILGFALVFGNSAFLWIAGAMITLLLLFSVGLRWSQRRSVRKKAEADARRYVDYLRERDRELDEAGELQRAALDWLYPDPGKLWTAVVKRRGVWERRPNHADFLHVRLGRGDVPLDRPVELDLGVNPLTEYQEEPLREARGLVERRSVLHDEPVVVDLSGVGVLAVTGARSRTRAWTRGLMAQLAAFRSPHDLRLVTCFDPADAAEWEWAKWLPHQRAERRPGPDRREDQGDAGPGPPMLTFARSVAELDAMLDAELRPRLEQLRRLSESGLAGRDVPLSAHTLVVVVDGFHPRHPAVQLPSFRELLARARELEAVLVLLVDERASEPSEIDARLTAPAAGTGSWELSGPDAPRIGEIALDEVGVGTSEAIARALAPLRLAESGDGERGLAADVRLTELLGLESASALDPAAAWRDRPRSLTLRAPIGVRADGELLELDLKQAAEGGMGPHGILVGATGSGKSELLRTLVAGLAAVHDPESLAFVLVDYKGGAAFAEVARLPHAAGLITNLEGDLTLVDRMRDALDGEQDRRQRMLRDAGDLEDIVAYRGRRESDPSLAPMPNLLVIVDEFAELLAARPEFIDTFVSLGRVGRSLGIHLLLSSQRLDEGRLRGLESHLRYRICLRTYSAPESKMVLGTPDAYLLPSLPGLGYLKVDTEVYTQFRAALATIPERRPAPAAAAPTAAVREFRPGADRSGRRAPAPAAARSSRTDLEALVERLGRGREPATAVHQVWLPPLPPAQPLDAVLAEPPWWEDELPAPGLRAPIGTLDLPAEQRMDPLVLDLAGAGGHLAVVGSPRTGKSTLLRTLAAALVWGHTPAEVRLYAIDLGGGQLAALGGAPHVGGVAGKADREAAQRVVRQLRAEIEDREQAFRRLGVESIAQVRAMRAAGELPGDGSDLPDVFLLVDGWWEFRRQHEDLEREVADLAASGLAYGIHVVVTATRWADIRPALLDNLGTRLELRLNDPLDSDVSKAAAASVPADVPGRGITSAGLHFQVALPRVDGRASPEGLAAALGTLVEEAARRWNGPPAEPIRLLPRRLDASELPPPGPDGIALGLEERTLGPVWLDLEVADPHFLVFGDAETGKSSLLRLIAGCIAATRSPEEARIVVVDVRRSLADLAALPHMLAYAATPPAAAEALGQAQQMLVDRVPAGDGAALVAPSAGPPVYVLFDDYDLVASPGTSPLAPLLDLLAVGREVGLHVVLARRVGGSARGSLEPGLQRVRELGSPGLILSGEPVEGPLVGGVKAAPQPPGRGLLVRRGLGPLVVQTAFAAPPPAAERPGRREPAATSAFPTS